MKATNEKSGYFNTIMQNQDLEAYLLLLKEIVRNTKARDMDHHEFYDEHVNEDMIDPEPIQRIEEELDLIEPLN